MPARKPADCESTAIVTGTRRNGVVVGKAGREGFVVGCVAYFEHPCGQQSEAEKLSQAHVARQTDLKQYQ